MPARGRARRALHRFPDTVRAYVGLTKTRIIEQLLVVTVPAMFLAERGIPPVPLILATLVGGATAAASAHALNCVIDADIDVKMKRTARRPLARGQVPPSHALVFGLVLAALSTVWLWLTTNQLAAGLALTAIAFYVLVYTLHPQAAHGAEHRVGRRGGLHAGGDRLGGGHRHGSSGRRW